MSARRKIPPQRIEPPLPELPSVVTGGVPARSKLPRGAAKRTGPAHEIRSVPTPDRTAAPGSQTSPVSPPLGPGAALSYDDAIEAVRSAGTRKRREQHESKIQAAFVELWPSVAPPRASMHANVNERVAPTKAHLGRMKALGMRAGVADISVLYEGRTHYLEFKTLKTAQTAAQKVFEAEVIHAGATYAVVRSAEEAHAALIAAGVPMRPAKFQ